MKKFLKKIVVSAFTLALFSMMLLFIISKLKYYQDGYFNKNLNRIRDLTEIEIGFFGHSQMRGGINTNLIQNLTQKKVENFSEGGSPIFFSIKWIEYLIKKNPNSKIVIEIGLIDLDSRGVVRNYKWDGETTSSYKELIEESFFLFNFNDIFFFLRNQNMFRNIQYSLKSILNPFKIIEGDEINEPELDKSLSNIKKASEFWNSKIDEHKDKFVDAQFKQLYNLIESNPKTEFLIITLPEHEINQKIFNNEYLINSKIENLISFKNVKYKSYLNLFEKDSMFENFNHLSKYGADKISKMMIKEFNSFFSE